MKLVVFDVDGTLIDSQGYIVAAMKAAFESCGLEAPKREQVLGGIGISLEPLMAHLAGEAHAAQLAQAYREIVTTQNPEKTSVLYPGTRVMLERLSARDDLLLAIATGKGKRGLDAMVEAHNFQQMFVSRQCADFHPSKPHPSMLMEAIADAGVDARKAVMVGDTRFDIEMARAAGVASIAVPWGYHEAAELGADRIIETWDEIDSAIDALVG